MSARRGLTLLEALVAVAVLSVGVVALERLLARSVAGVGADALATRAMVAAQAMLAEAVLAPPEPGHIAGTRPDGLHFERDVWRTPHPRLREVRVRVYGDQAGSACELVELVRVPAA
jgi:prepilin-type N-terminal cleavage/methylation domain-containing protein